MSRRRKTPAVPLGDALALRVQDLHRKGKVRDGHPLLRIDQRREAAAAPFQLDAATGRVHRTGCTAIPGSSRSALYGLWAFEPEHAHLACRRCAPAPRKAQRRRTSRAAPASDLLYGVLSLLDQFGGVLRERGRDYRGSSEGQALGDDLTELYERLGTGERRMLDVIASALDGVTTTLQKLDRELSGRNGNGSNGHHRNGNGAGTPEPRRPPGTRGKERQWHG